MFPLTRLACAYAHTHTHATLTSSSSTMCSAWYICTHTRRSPPSLPCAARAPSATPGPRLGAGTAGSGAPQCPTQPLRPHGAAPAQKAARCGPRAGGVGHVQEVWAACRRCGPRAGGVGHVQEVWATCRRCGPRAQMVWATRSNGVGYVFIRCGPRA